MKPKLVLAPVPSVPLKLRLVAFTALPVWVQVADQLFVLTCWLPGKVKVSAQEVIGSPVFASVTEAVKVG